MMVAVTGTSFAGENDFSGGGALGAAGGSGLFGDVTGGNALASGWEVTGAAGLSLAQGNADSLAYSVQVLATYEGENWEGLIGGDYFYAENDGETSTDSLRIFGQAQRLLTDRLYLGLAGSYLRDDVADLDYRYDVAAILGYHVIKNDRATLSFEVGPGYAFEKQGGETDNFATIRFAERFDYQISKRSKFWQSAVVTPQIDDFNNFNLIAEAGIDTLLSDNWSLRTSVRYLYDNTPAEGSNSDDLTLTVGLAYALGGIPEPDAPAGRATLAPEAEAPAAAAMGWTTTAALGVSTAQGNSDNLQASLAYDTAYRSATNEWFLTGLYTFGESDGDKSADALQISSRYNRLLSERFYVGGGVDYLRDDIAELDYRVTAIAYAGYYVIKNDQVSLSFEGGPGNTWEESNGEQNSYFTLRAAERFSWVLSDRVTFKQNAILDLDPADFDNYLLTVGAYLDTQITDSLSWRLGGTYIYDNQPNGDLENYDATLTSGIAVKF